MTEEEKRIINELESLIEVKVVDFYENGNKKSENFKPAIYDELRINSYTSKIILNLIQKQDTEINKLKNVIDRTTKYIEELIGSCPYDTFDYKVRNCEEECKDQMAECWKEYFMNKTDKGKEG